VARRRLAIRVIARASGDDHLRFRSLGRPCSSTAKQVDQHEQKGHLIRFDEETDGLHGKGTADRETAGCVRGDEPTRVERREFDKQGGSTQDQDSDDDISNPHPCEGRPRRSLRGNQVHDRQRQMACGGDERQDRGESPPRDVAPRAAFTGVQG